MEKETMGMILQNLDVYDSIAKGSDTIAKIRMTMRKEKGIDGGNLQRRVVDLKDPKERAVKYPFVNVEGEEVFLDSDGLFVYLRDFAKGLGLDLLEKGREADQSMKEMSLKLIYMKNEVDECYHTIDAQSERIKDLDDEIARLKKENMKAETERKVLVASSIKVGPQKELTEDIFLDDPKKLLDVEKLVTIYGGELDSFYEEIPSDKEEAMPDEEAKKYDPKYRDRYETIYEPGRELTQDNYRSRTMKRIGTKRLFEKRLKDIEMIKEFEEEHGAVFPDSTELMYNPEDNSTARKRERNRILKNRFETLNRIIECDEFTNQEKLMLFALNGNFKHGFMQQYLEHAGKYCINANFLIYLLQGTNPNVCETYDNMIAFLDQFLCPSEFRMKLDLARELIEGKWYIEAEYNGRKTKFQLVPIDEFNELRQRVGLPVSELRYKGDDKPADKTEKKKEGSGSDAAKVAKVVNMDKYDIPDDGFRQPDDDLPFGPRREG